MFGMNNTVKAVKAPAVFLIFMLALFAAQLAQPQVAEAKVYDGTFMYTYGHPEQWGIGQGDQSGYTLLCTVEKAGKNKARVKIDQSFFYGPSGYYQASMKASKTVKLKKNRATFKFKSYGGDTVKAKLKVVSKKKVKLALKTVAGHNERIAFSTGYKYKTLKRMS